MSERFTPFHAFDMRGWKAEPARINYEIFPKPDIEAVLALAVLALLCRLQEQEKSAIDFWLVNTNASELKPESNVSEA